MSHLAVFIPVAGGKLCILDPAGNYRTSSQGSTTYKEPLSELKVYSSYWDNNGQAPISKIILYSVDTTDGSHHIVSQGTISDITNFLSR